MVRPRLSSASLTVVILTLNEEARLPRCLAAVPERYPILVVDSGSSDRTVETAREAGCQVVGHAWPGFAGQRNFALASAEITSPWVLFVDADELYPPAFFDWFENEAKRRDDFDVAMVDSRLVLAGRELRYAPGYPIYHPRLIRRGTVRFEPNHNGDGETIEAGARCLAVDIPYRHYFHDGDLAAWMIKHIPLARAQAFAAPPTSGLVTARGRLSLLARRLPLRPLARFFYHYVVRGGFRDGRAGLIYALMYAWYEMSLSLIRLGQERTAARSR